MHCKLLSRLLTIAAFAGIALAAHSTLFSADKPTLPQVVIMRGGTVYDGTGAPGKKADVLIIGDTIKAIGQNVSAFGARVLNAKGLIVCPGFIDVHNHAHEGYPGRPLPRDAKARMLEALVGQGITTTIAGLDGSGALPLAAYAEELAKHPCSPNIGRLVGHTAVREMVVGKVERPATPDELAKMAALVDQAMKSGAFGLSSGLEYLGDYVTIEEMIALARAVAPYGGYYETHVRNEDVGVFEAVEEAVRICRQGGNIPLSISHIKVGSYAVWHRAGKLEKIMDAARAKGLRVYANWRPSINWASDLKSFDPKGERNLTAIEAEIRKYWPNADAYCFKCPSHPEIEGKTLDKIAARWGISPAEALVKTWDFGDAAFEYDAMSWEDKRVFINDPWVMVTSDGTDGIEMDRLDPLIWRCFPIFFGKMIREWKWFPMEAAIYKCTGLPAELVGLKDRGILKPGMKADIVVFDPNAIDGDSHWGERTPPKGIAYTFVNGVIVMDHGKHTGARPGVFLKKR